MKWSVKPGNHNTPSLFSSILTSFPTFKHTWLQLLAPGVRSNLSCRAETTHNFSSTAALWWTWRWSHCSGVSRCKFTHELHVSVSYWWTAVRGTSVLILLSITNVLYHKNGANQRVSGVCFRPRRTLSVCWVQQGKGSHHESPLWLRASKRRDCSTNEKHLLEGRPCALGFSSRCGIFCRDHMTGKTVVLAPKSQQHALHRGNKKARCPPPLGRFFGGNQQDGCKSNWVKPSRCVCGEQTAAASQLKATNAVRSGFVFYKISCHAHMDSVTSWRLWCHFACRGVDLRISADLSFLSF